MYRRTPCFLLFVAAVAAGLIARAGSLEPPGPPAPTMKNLDLVEPRVPISQANIPLTIEKPGSYYLTGNVLGPAGETPTITISASNVTLDLSGFQVDAGTATYGVLVSTGFKNVLVRNGTIVNARIGAATLFQCVATFEDLRVIQPEAVSGLVQIGFESSGRYVRFRRCFASGMHQPGFGLPGSGFLLGDQPDGVVEMIDSAARDCQTGAYINAGDARVEGSSFSFNGTGVQAIDFISLLRSVVVIDSVAQGNTTGFSSTTPKATFLRNFADNNTTDYSGIANVRPPATAGPWDNIAP